jgi:hypothetical protein
VVPDNDGSSRPTGSGLLLLYREEATAPPALELRFLLLLLYSVHCSDKETGALYQSPVQTMKRVRTRHTTTLEARSIHGECESGYCDHDRPREETTQAEGDVVRVCARARLMIHRSSVAARRVVDPSLIVSTIHLIAHTEIMRPSFTFYHH